MSKCSIILKSIFLALVVMSGFVSCKKEDSNVVTAIHFTNVLSNEITIGIGQTFRLKYVLEPYALTETAQIEWTSSKKSVASVRSGRVTGNELGTTIITASCGNVSASVKVNVEVIPVKDFSLPEKTFAYVGKNAKVDVSIISPDDAGVDGIEWSVADESIATCEVVDGNLYITAHKEGVTTLMGEAKDGGKKRTCTIETATYYPVTSIEVSMESASISAGKSVAVTLKVLPSNASVKDVTWAVEPSSLATFDQKQMLLTTGLTPGTVTLKATAINEEISGSVQLEITEAVDLFCPPDAPEGHICPDGSFDGYPKSITMIPCFPSSVNTESIKWKSYDTSRATVDENGTVTAVGHGAVLIEASVGEVTIQRLVRSFKKSSILWKAYTPESRNLDDYVESVHKEISSTIGMAGYTSFWVIDGAAWYKTSRADQLDKNFYPKVNGVYPLPEVSSTTKAIAVNVLDQFPRLVECRPSVVGSGEVAVDMGIGEILTKKMDAKVTSVSFVEYHFSYESCITIANGGTYTFSKSRDGESAGYDHIFYANYSNEYDCRLHSSRRIYLDCSPEEYRFGEHDEYLLWDSKYFPKPGTFTFTFRSHPDGFDPGEVTFTFRLTE